MFIVSFTSDKVESDSTIAPFGAQDRTGNAGNVFFRLLYCMIESLICVSALWARTLRPL